jgi:hypothetical protein
VVLTSVVLNFFEEVVIPLSFIKKKRKYVQQTKAGDKPGDQIDKRLKPNNNSATATQATEHRTLPLQTACQKPRTKPTLPKHPRRLLLPAESGGQILQNTPISESN